MSRYRFRILALAAVAALAAAGPARAEEAAPAAKAPADAKYLDKAAASNRVVAARMWSDLQVATQRLRAEAAAEDWPAALRRVREVRAHIERLGSSRVVEHQARLIIAELHPFAVDIEERIVKGRGRTVLRGVDTLIGHVGRAQQELIAAGHMTPMGGGAGLAPPTDENLERRLEDPNRNLSPGHERNQMEDWRGPED